MFFRDLPDNVKNAIKDLTGDQEFQDNFGHDEILDKLDDEKFDVKKSYIELKAFLGHRLKIEEKSFKHLTPIVWSTLWCIQNPIIFQGKTTPKDISIADLDIFFYLLENGVNEDILDNIPIAFGYCEKNIISLEEGLEIVRTLISMAFTPLKMFPQSQAETIVENEEMLIYDADWLSSMISKVHEMTGKDVDDIMNNMTLNACCQYYVQYARKQGAKNVERRANIEILEAQDKRCCELIVETLLKKDIIKEDEKEDILNKMTTPPENK